MELAVHGLKTSARLDLSGLTDNQTLKSIDLRKQCLSGGDMITASFRDMTTLIEQKALIPAVSRVYPLSKTGEAMAYVETGAHIGKVVISHSATEMTDNTGALKEALKQQKVQAENIRFKSFSDTNTHHSLIEIPGKTKTQPPKVKDIAIAIIGMSGVFPDSKDINEFWENLKAGKNLVREVPKDRWDTETWYDADPQAKGKSYSKWMGVLEDVDKFDPLFFSISPKEAELMDPQQRLFLEESWKAIEDAGYAASSLSCLLYTSPSPRDS